mgnify:CR=1 FL=1
MEHEMDLFDVESIKEGTKEDYEKECADKKAAAEKAIASQKAL